MMFWNKTITLYNKREEAETGLIKWYRHTIDNCFYKTTNNTVNVGNAQLKTDDNVIRIPIQENYVAPHEWNALSDEEMRRHITLQGGDLIVLGNVTEEIDEYTTGKRSSDLIAKYKTLGTVFINSVNVNDFLPGAHYFVRGE